MALPSLSSIRAVAFAGTLLMWGSVAARAQSFTASPIVLSGRILGVVTDTAGIPQMGATVLLFDRLEKLRQRATTDPEGRFAFDRLAAGAYAVRVTLTSFAPVLKPNVLVQPGETSFLNVSLAGLFSSITLVYPNAERRSLMSDDWKWVLRTSAETRPVLRLLPDIMAGTGVSTRASQSGSAWFTDTRGLVKVSAGEGGRLTSFGAESDLGTAFALATSFLGRGEVQVAGNFGYAAQSGMPSAGFRTSFSRENVPEVSLTMRQLFAPGRVADSLTTNTVIPVLRTMSLSVDDAQQLTDYLRFEYGFSLDSVTFFDRLNYASPYGRLKYALTDGDTLIVSYSSGLPRPDWASRGGLPASADAGLQEELTSLALFPRISTLGGRAKVERRQNFEIGYTKVWGSRKYRAAAFRERVTNAGLMLAGGDNLVGSGDILPDLFSNSSVFNAGAFQTLGYMVSATQSLFGDNLATTMMFSSGGALLAREQFLPQGTTAELRNQIFAGRRRAVSAEIAGNAPWTGTHFVASYQWTDRRTATPAHYFLTQGVRAEAGLNVYIRQPIPALPLLPIRMEASADLRNLLAQGYLPFTTVDGSRIILMHTPRSIRGGVSFIF